MVSEPFLVINAGETAMHLGMRAHFKAGLGNAHHLINRTDREIVYLEIGDRKRRRHRDFTRMTTSEGR
jgi:uncharacterized cupin superfamily protein